MSLTLTSGMRLSEPLLDQSSATAALMQLDTVDTIITSAMGGDLGGPQARRDAAILVRLLTENLAVIARRIDPESSGEFAQAFHASGRKQLVRLH